MTNRELLRWALADHAFREARILAQHLLISNTPEGTHLFSAIVAGIATCYCRPFVGGAGMGSLPEEIKKLERFDGVQHEREVRIAHEMLRDTRNKILGHHDRIFHEQLYAKHGFAESPSEVTIDLQPLGSSVSVNSLHIDRNSLVAVDVLCVLQLTRIGEKLGQFGLEYLAKNMGRFGTIKITITDQNADLPCL